MRKFQLMTAHLILCCGLSLLGSAAKAQEGAGSGAYIRITDAKFKKSLMALPAFQLTGVAAASPQHLKVGKELYDVFRQDMEVSGFFDFIKPDAFLEDPAKVGLKPSPQEAGGFTFPAWKQIGTEFLVRVGYRMTGSEVVMDAYLYHVPQAKLVLGRTYRGNMADVRSVAHTFANDVVKELTGLRGMFLSRIAVSRTAGKDKKEIFIMDWDGANARQVTTHKSITVSPAWSFDGKTLAYSAYAYHPARKTRNLDMFTYNPSTGQRQLVSYRPGLNSGASFFPDGRNLLLTISNAGNPDIYRMSIDGRRLERLTNGPRGAMNVEPAASPDGSQIAFSSDRNERPHIFIMNADGSNIRRITIAGTYNSAPRWSPDGQRLVFAGYDKGHFDLFTVAADGSDMLRLTSARKPNGKMADNEDPSYSPDGRHILFVSNRTGRKQLYTVSVDGEVERRISYDQNDYSKPHWSPAFE